jgi:hypothetical protein
MWLKWWHTTCRACMRSWVQSPEPVQNKTKNLTKCLEHKARRKRSMAWRRLAGWTSPCHKRLIGIVENSGLYFERKRSHRRIHFKRRATWSDQYLRRTHYDCYVECVGWGQREFQETGGKELQKSELETMIEDWTKADQREAGTS